MAFAVFFSVYLYTTVIKSKQLRSCLGKNELQDSSRARQDKHQASCPASPCLLPSLPPSLPPLLPLPLFFDLETGSRHLCMNSRKQSGSRLRNQQSKHCRGIGAYIRRSCSPAQSTSPQSSWKRQESKP